MAEPASCQYRGCGESVTGSSQGLCFLHLQIPGKDARLFSEALKRKVLRELSDNRRSLIDLGEVWYTLWQGEGKSIWRARRWLVAGLIGILAQVCLLHIGCSSGERPGPNDHTESDDECHYPDCSLLAHTRPPWIASLCPNLVRYPSTLSRNCGPPKAGHAGKGATPDRPPSSGLLASARPTVFVARIVARLLSLVARWRVVGSRNLITKEVFGVLRSVGLSLLVGFLDTVFIAHVFSSLALSLGGSGAFTIIPPEKPKWWLRCNKSCNRSP